MDHRQKNFTPSEIQASFMKFTAQQLKRSMMKNDIDLLASLKVNKYDREYQIWKREPLCIELLDKTMLIQKLEYIHYNPVRAGLCELPENYHYSSARFYQDGRMPEEKETLTRLTITVAPNLSNMEELEKTYYPIVAKFLAKSYQYFRTQTNPGLRHSRDTFIGQSKNQCI